MPIFCSKGARLFPAANPLCAQGMAAKGLPQNRRTHRPARRICAVCRGILPARLADGSCGFLQKMNMIEIRKGRADGRSALPFPDWAIEYRRKTAWEPPAFAPPVFFCLRRFSPPAISSCAASYAGACAFARSGMPCLRPAPALFPADCEN